MVRKGLTSVATPRGNARAFSLVKQFDTVTRQLLASDEATGAVFRHGTIIGEHAESLVRDAIRFFVTAPNRIETGQVVSTTGSMSPQCDLIIFQDRPGSIVGRSGTGHFLVRLDAVRAVIELKRSLLKPTVKKLQGYAKTLSSWMSVSAECPRWLQWCIALRSERTSEQLLRDLDADYHEEASIGRLLVLDVPRTAAQLSKMYALKRAAAKTRGTALRQLIKEVEAPNAVQIVRGTDSYRVESEPGVPALLSFVIALEQTLERMGDMQHVSLSDFLPNGRGR